MAEPPRQVGRGQGLGAWARRIKAQLHIGISYGRTSKTGSVAVMTLCVG